MTRKPNKIGVSDKRVTSYTWTHSKEMYEIVT